MRGVAKPLLSSCVQLFKILTAALLTHVVFVFSDVVLECATCCATCLNFVAGGRVQMSNFGF